MVLRAGFKKQLRLYVELKIYDKNRRKITGPQCVKILHSDPFAYNVVVVLNTQMVKIQVL
jgi:hypothetical protein